MRCNEKKCDYKIPVWSSNFAKYVALTTFNSQEKKFKSLWEPLRWVPQLAYKNCLTIPNHCHRGLHILQVWNLSLAALDLTTVYSLLEASIQHPLESRKDKGEIDRRKQVKLERSKTWECQNDLFTNTYSNFDSALPNQVRSTEIDVSQYCCCGFYQLLRLRNQRPLSIMSTQQNSLSIKHGVVSGINGA